MKIHKLRLQNLRGFVDQTFEFSDQINILIGDNGTGKTTILDALAYVLDQFALNLSRENPSIPIFNYPRLVRLKKGQTITLERQYPIRVESEGDINQTPWQETFIWDSKHGGWIPAHSLPKISSQLAKDIQAGKDITLPLIAYYSAGRLWGQKQEQDQNSQWGELGSRLDGYKGCLNPASNEAPLIAWLKGQEAIALQQGQPHGIFTAVKEAIANCMELWDKVRYDFVEDDLLATSLDETQTLPFRALSDGQRNMLATVADIAHRAAILNPQLEADAVKLTPGIVLIDEIDLHLHPKWQRRVVDDLRSTFPQVQFIATTHSPYIIQSLQDGELIDLNQREPAEYHNRSIDDISEWVLGVPLPQQSERYQKMMTVAEEYYRKLQQAKQASPAEIEHLKIELDELVAPFSNDVAYHTFLKLEREAAGLGGSSP